MTFVYIVLGGILWHTLNKTFRKMISLSHQIQGKLGEIHADVVSRPVVVVPGGGDTTVRGQDAGPASRPAGPGPWVDEEPVLPASREASFDSYTRARDRFLFIEELLPHEGFDQQVVLDFGCGRGRETVGFLEHSRPRHLVGMDACPQLLEHTRQRALLHRKDAVELILVEDLASPLPLADGSVDYIHCGGLLHLRLGLERLLPEFRRILSKQGRMRMVVFQRASTWLQLCVPWQGLGSRLGAAREEPLPAFRRSLGFEGAEADAPLCLTPSECSEMASRHGLDARLLGCAVSSSEMAALPHRFEALDAGLLTEEQVSFVRGLAFDVHGRPLHGGQVAGLLAVYELSSPPV